jgi:hypothetical protein
LILLVLTDVAITLRSAEITDHGISTIFPLSPPRSTLRCDESLHWFPTLWQHIECQRVTVGVLIAFQYCHWRQHVPDAVIIEDVTLTAFAHSEAIHFVFIIVSDDDFAAASAAAAQ